MDLPLKHWRIDVGLDETGCDSRRFHSGVYGWVDQERRFQNEPEANTWATKQRRDAKTWFAQWRRSQ